jgi:hypothetical protein
VKTRDELLARADGGRAGVLPLAEVRATLAAALAPVGDSDPDVLADTPHSVEPPLLFLQWGSPWLEPTPRPGAGRTFGPCLWLARIDVVCVAGRVDPAPGIETLERLVAYVIDRLAADQTYVWPPGLVSRPGTGVWGDIRYQTADVTYELTTTTERGA